MPPTDPTRRKPSLPEGRVCPRVSDAGGLYFEVAPLH